ncbi:hypothetical protein, partial [Streptomyces sp. NPDC093707]|uniref:hypothetical protein n=1 Tax=Streptomyces sp. NPDC093707 TaxID=3154984 RepID=UPI00344BF11A
GIGVIPPGVDLRPQRVVPGDVVIVSGAPHERSRLTVGERVPRVSAREQPGSVVRNADLGLAAAGRDELAGQAGQRRGQDDRQGR